MRIRALILVSLICAVSGWMWLNSQKKKPVYKEDFIQQSEPQRNPAAVSPVQKTEAAVASVPAHVTTESSKPTLLGQIPKPENIEKFKVIQAKVFKSDEELKYLKNLIADKAYLIQLGKYLQDLQSLSSEDFKTNQNAVIDLLIEALKNGDATVAEQAILEVIKDTQVEDAQIAKAKREVLGGIKAELLYQSTSLKPELVQQIESVLPGPVSQKIWKNVQRQQADNLALSEAEQESRSAAR